MTCTTDNPAAPQQCFWHAGVSIPRITSWIDWIWMNFIFYFFDDKLEVNKVSLSITSLSQYAVQYAKSFLWGTYSGPTRCATGEVAACLGETIIGFRNWPIVFRLFFSRKNVLNSFSISTNPILFSAGSILNIGNQNGFYSLTYGFSPPTC